MGQWRAPPSGLLAPAGVWDYLLSLGPLGQVGIERGNWNGTTLSLFLDDDGDILQTSHFPFKVFFFFFSYATLLRDAY